MDGPHFLHVFELGEGCVFLEVVEHAQNVLAHRIGVVLCYHFLIKFIPLSVDDRLEFSPVDLLGNSVGHCLFKAVIQAQ